MAILTRTKEELAAALAALEGDTALVMTMGALHDGHMSLVRAAREVADNVVVSIYVNPLQFAPNEDFDAYPRTLEADMELLDAVGVEVVFAPSDEAMYPRDPLVLIEPGPMATVYEGATRPTHFAGVLMVVHKVMNLVRPRYAFFGQKDAQQLALIRTMVADLDMPVEIRAVPIRRDVDGLALSSRNSYLSETERIEALALSQALSLGADRARAGGTPAEVLEAARTYLGKAPGVRVDYLALVDPQTFVPLAGDDAPMAPGGGAGLRARGGNVGWLGSETEPAAVPAEGEADRALPKRGLLAVAAWVGPTRLIDNAEVELHG